MATQTLDLARLLGLDPLVHQAVGMIAAQIGQSVEAAAMQLMAAAEARGAALESIAADVVARRTRFEPETSTGEMPG